MRLSFIWRLTIVTLVASLASTFAILLAVERMRERALTNAYEITAVRRVVTELTGPLTALATTNHLDAASRTALARADADVRRFDPALGVRVYRRDGRALFPQNAPAEPEAVAAALQTDAPTPRTAASQTEMFVPFRSGGAALVVAEDFVSIRVADATRPGWKILDIAGVAGAVLAVALAVLAAGASFELERRRRDDQASFVHTLALMAEALELRDPYTAGHSQRVAAFSRKLAVALKLAPQEIDVIEGAALLHDIGKMGIPDPLLFKAGPLDDAEWRTIATHPALGARLLRGIKSMREVTPCVLHHHERIDGLGYPSALAGDDIPMGARIIAIADTFDAMTSDRPYRAATSANDAVRELRRVANKQLDAAFVEVFVGLVNSGEIVPAVGADR